MPPVPPSTQRRCRVCDCILSFYNDDDICSPCRSRELVDLYRHPGRIRTPEDLEDQGITVYIMSIQARTSREAIQHAIENRLLPTKMGSNMDKVVQLVDDLRGVSHAEAARTLGVSRFTVSSWRRRLGLHNENKESTDNE